jgi:hypothetical protein
VNAGAQHYWRPINRQIAHPVLRAEKREAARLKLQQRVAARRDKDRGRQEVLRKAERAERQTEQSIIKATVNSGRQKQDGDHISMGRIVLDTKHQSRRDNPVVMLEQLEKVRADARRNGYSLGALVLRNKHGRGVVVIAEEDYANLVQGVLGHA